MECSIVFTTPHKHAKAVPADSTVHGENQAHDRKLAYFSLCLGKLWGRLLDRVLGQCRYVKCFSALPALWASALYVTWWECTRGVWHHWIFDDPTVRMVWNQRNSFLYLWASANALWNTCLVPATPQKHSRAELLNFIPSHTRRAGY